MFNAQFSVPAVSRRFHVFRARNLLLMVLLAVFVTGVGATSGQAASIATDRDDYPPGDSVIIYGYDFMPGETVHMTVMYHDSIPPTGPGQNPWDVVADGSGDFETFWIVPDSGYLNDTMLIEATGLESGLTASTTITDKSTELYFSSTIPDSVCTGGGTFDVCAILVEKCTGGGTAPLEGREVRFYINEGNCGVNVGQEAFDTVLTGPDGEACTTVPIPTTSGDYSIRAKFLGESKPSPEDSANSACDTTQRVELSNSNVCQVFVVDPAICNEPPECTVPNDTTIFLCGLTQVCLPVSCYDPDGNLTGDSPSIVSGPGSIVSGDWCYTPTGAGTVTVTIRCEDTRGEFCEATFNVTFLVNSAPVATCPGTQDLFVCDLSDICIDGFSSYDADDNIASVTVSPGTLTGSEVCFTPQEGANVITMIVTDECGDADTCTTTVNVTLNSAPVATCPGTQDEFVCDLSDICVDGFSTFDADDNIASVTVSPGTLTGSEVCFTPQEGANVVTMIVTDECGAADTCTTTVNVTLNSAPVATCPGTQDLFVCDLSDICVDGFSTFDADDNIASVTVSPGTLTGTEVCFTPQEGANVITMIVTDECGAADTCTTTVNVALNSPPVVTCPGDTTLFACGFFDICLPGYSVNDVDDGLITVNVTGGWIDGDQVCFSPVEGDNVITVVATDPCGAADTCSFTATVIGNQFPWLNVPEDQEEFLCESTELCYDITFGDPDYPQYHSAPEATLIEGPGTLTLTSPTSATLCFTPGDDGTYAFVVEVCDSCGIPSGVNRSPVNSCVVDTFHVTVTINLPPVAECPESVTTTLCGPEEFCIGPFSCSDPDDGIESAVIVADVQGGVFDGTDFCFWVPEPGDYEIMYVVTDYCGVADTCTTTVTIDGFYPPPLINDTTYIVAICQPGSVCFVLPGIEYSSPLVSVTADGESVVDEFCLNITQSDTVEVQLIVTDSCGKADTAIATVQARVNVAPTVTAVGPFDTFICSSGETVAVKLDILDPDNHLTGSSQLGWVDFSDSTVKFIADTAGVYCDDVMITDSCGLSGSDQYCVTVTINSPPVVECPVDTAVFRCGPSEEICVGPFTASDPDDNLNHTSVSFGTLTGTEVCFTADTAGVYSIEFTAYDDCEASASCITEVTVTFNEGPSITNCPGLAQNVPFGQTFIYDFEATDPEGQDLTFILGTGSPGNLSGDGRYTWTPGPQDVCEHEITVIVIDSCSENDVCLFTLCVTNTPPTAICSGDLTTCWGGMVEGQVSGTDPEDAPLGLTYSVASFNGPGTVDIDPATGEFSWVTEEDPDYIGSFELCLAVSDNANTCDPCSPSNADTCCLTITVVPSFHVWIEKTHGSMQGQVEHVSIYLDSSYNNYLMGGFNFLVEYDPSVLNFMEAQPGSFIENCGWEYFQYRFGANGNCGLSACPSGVVRIVAMAETNDGVESASCFAVVEGGPGELADMAFLVSNNRIYECQYVPIRFRWYTCNDNAVSSVGGDTLFISRYVYDYGNPPEHIEDPGLSFPTLQGAISLCDVMDKTWPVRCSDFYDGGIDIICADDIDDRGDVNLNGIAYEVADVVMFTNYFVSGLSAFEPYVEGAVAATDANADGLTLSVADLVWMIRVITGDAWPYPKTTPLPGTYEVEDGVISVGQEVGAVHLVLAGDAEPILLADNVEMVYSFDGKDTKVLVYSMRAGVAIHGDVLESDGEVLTIEMATYDGRPIAAKMVPGNWELAQNYPNPFNPTTTIKFTMPTGGAWNLKIFNVTGQQVDEFSGYAEPGTVTQVWNAGSNSSGVYFYRIETDEFSATRKMILLK
ncbi:MAG: T9SS type A sorting domain-containing protein [Candidatus Zixiibacteriota bacterium]|nr:MAG: T9SS type A sorting domain-containing protein [candidate division Zixibacteria bacterium]